MKSKHERPEGSSADESTPIVPLILLGRRAASLSSGGMMTPSFRSVRKSFGERKGYARAAARIGRIGHGVLL